MAGNAALMSGTWANDRRCNADVSSVLSGGLHSANVAGAIRMIRPWAVDVSSGVEMHNGPKGTKDHARIWQFIEEVRNADAA